MAFELLIIRQAALLAGCAAAAYTDARTGLILDKITYPMIGLGVVLNVWEQQWLWLAIGAAVFALGYAAYYTGKFGGGDVKLFTGIALLLPFYAGEPFLLNALFASSVIAVAFYSTYYFARYARKGIEWKENRQGLRKALLLGTVLAAWLFASSLAGTLAWQTSLALLIPLAFAVLFMAFEKGIRKRFFLRQVSLGKLEEDEVIAEEFLDERASNLLGLGFKGVFGEKERQKLEKAGIKSVPVYRGLPPFAPFILLGCALAMLYPGLIGLLFL